MDPSMSLQRLAPDPGAEALPVGEQLTVTALYEAHVDFVWRGLRRLGVPASRLDDAVQDVFLVVHRRLDSFEVRSSVKTWLFGIVLRVARDHHRSRRRNEQRAATEAPPDPELLVDETSSGPLERAQQADAIRLLDELLSGMSAEKREVFLLAELEQMTAPEIGEALGVRLTTVYSRLRSARIEFEQALARRRVGAQGGKNGSE
jgi:RNA polymerase sigma-70 factor (ECF subfamily)